MTIHVWKHWFWITNRILVIFFYLGVAVSVAPTTEAGVVQDHDSSTTPSDRYRVVSTETPNNDAAQDKYVDSDSDMDDTFNGESSDVIVAHPIKKYNSKYFDHVLLKKYKGKPKLEEGSEKAMNVLEPGFSENVSRPTLSLSSTATSLILDQNVTTVFNTTEAAALSDDPLDGSSNSTAEVVPAFNETENYAEDIDPTSVEPYSLGGNMAVAAATSVDHELQTATILDAGSITGITLGIVVISGLFGAITFVLYRRRYLNKPQALTDKSSTLDSSGYIDDTSLRENSEEMYSLDNDSFLNSLEAMTIQNYWTESVKHTKL